MTCVASPAAAQLSESSISRRAAAASKGRESLELATDVVAPDAPSMTLPVSVTQRLRQINPSSQWPPQT